MINAIFGHDYDHDEHADTARCPECGGEGVSMGFLGFLQWFRCRACGWDFPVDTRQAAPSPIPES